MRTFAVPLLGLLVSLSVVAQRHSKTVISTPAGDLYIPAVLDKSVHSERAHIGDEVRLDVVEAILAGYGVVIPTGTHLYGHIVDTEPLKPSSESRLGIEVDRAEWRDTELPLHAFVSGLGTTTEIIESGRDPKCDLPGAPPTQAKGSGPADAFPGFPSAFGEEEESCLFSKGRQTVIQHRGINLTGIQLEVHAADGSTTFVSSKKNVHLPGGLLLMLHNVALPRAGTQR